MIVLIDNYDSFTYNLYQMIGSFEQEIKVIRNDEITGKELMALNPSHIIISPGPKTPTEAGNCIDIITEVQGDIPILGVCLGHQSIGQAYGGTVSHAKELMHGKSAIVPLKEDVIFKDLGTDMQVARYHSLIVEQADLPECFEVLSETADGEIMAMKHKEYPLYGLQFHPESILTIGGEQIIKNFLYEVK